MAPAIKAMSGAVMISPTVDPSRSTSRLSSSCHPLRLGAVSSTSGSPPRHTVVGCTPAIRTDRGTDNI